MVTLFFYLFAVAIIALFLAVVRFAWHAGNAILAERYWTRVLAHRNVVEQQVALELIKCSATNPEAAAILQDRIQGWDALPSEKERREYLALFINFRKEEPSCDSPQPQ